MRGRAAVALMASLALAACGTALRGGDGSGAADGAAAGSAAAAQATAEGPPVGRDVARSLDYPPLRFDPPEPVRFELSNGVPVFLLRDPSLPLVDVFLSLRGGYVHFDRESYAAAWGLLPIMRDGGTATLPPDSVDALIADHALALGSSRNGSRMRLTISALRHQLDTALALWSDILLHPRLDPAAVERWRTRELETVRRLPDLPGSLAVAEFNRLAFGDHPTGWRLTPEDLAPDRLDRARLEQAHRRILCPENGIIGAAGDITVPELRAALERVLSDWRPCGHGLQDPPPPTLAPDPTVYVIHRPVDQSTIIVGQPGGVRLEDAGDYFASRVANQILGGGGFGSRLMSRLRTEEGLAYSAASVWGVARDHERILGGITHTRPDETVRAARLMLETFREARTDPPDAREVELARTGMLAGWVFGFGSPSQIVSRQVAYMVDDLPGDWLARYTEGIAAVDRRAVGSVLRRKIDPDAFTVMVVGDTTRFDASELESLGPVRQLPGR